MDALSRYTFFKYYFRGYSQFECTGYMSYCVRIPLFVVTYKESAICFLGLWLEFVDISLVMLESSMRPWEKHVDSLTHVAIPVSSGFNLLLGDRIWHKEFTIIEWGTGNTHGLEYGNVIWEFCIDSATAALFGTCVTRPALRWNLQYTQLSYAVETKFFFFFH